MKYISVSFYPYETIDLPGSYILQYMFTIS